MKRLDKLNKIYRQASNIIDFPKFRFVSTAPIEAGDYALAESRKFGYGKTNEDNEEIYNDLTRYWLHSHFNTSNLSRRPKMTDEDKIKLWGHTGQVTSSELERKEIFKAVMKDIQEGGSSATGTWFKKNKKGKGVPHWTPTGTAWSAAFVSSVMSKVDGNAIWPTSESHSTYRRSAKNNRRRVEKNPDKYIGKEFYMLFDRSELERHGGKIERGDVVGDGHMDIVSNDNPYMVIGGNTKSDVYEQNDCDGCTVGVMDMKKRPFSKVIKRVKVVGGPKSGNV